MVHTEGRDPRGSKSQKVHLSPDWSLQLDSMKLESLVIADQHAAVNTFPGTLHTARHTMGVGLPEVVSPAFEGSAYGRTDDWGEVVTR